MDELFQAQKDNPPLHKNHPPVAGAIFWERSLFHRIKHTIVRFLTMEDMMQSEMGKHVSDIMLLLWQFLARSCTYILVDLGAG